MEEKSTTKVEEHPLDEAFAVLKDSFDAVMVETLSEADRLAALQEPVNNLAAAIKRSVSEDDLSVVHSDVLNSEVVKAAIQAAVAPLQAEINALTVKVAESGEVKPTKPVRRAINLSQSSVVSKSAPASKYPSLRSICRRSVGIRED